MFGDVVGRMLESIRLKVFPELRRTGRARSFVLEPRAESFRPWSILLCHLMAIYALLHYTISPRAGFEDDDEDENSLSDVAFCARWPAVLSASEVGRTKRLARARRPYIELPEVAA
jgi:hypothetical protein